jgi:hypothetical protein
MNIIARIFIVLLFFVFTSSSLQAQVYFKKYFTKYKKDVKEIVFVSPSAKGKDSKRNAVAKKLTERLETFLKQNWKLSVPYKVIDDDDAYKYARSKEGVLLAEFVEKRDLKYGNTCHEFRIIIGNQRTVKSVIQIFLSNTLSTRDTVYAINSSQFIFENVEKFESKDLLKECTRLYGAAIEKKTLLIPTTFADSKMTEKEIKEVYPYAYKIVSPEEIAKAILTKDATCIVAYDISILSESGGYNLLGWILYQPSDGAVVNYSTDRPLMKRVGFSLKDLKAIIKNKNK